MPGSDRLRVHVDFNDMDQEGRFFVLPEDVEDGTLDPGSAVVLVDEEGNNALGHVAELMERGQALVAMTAGSWRSDAAVALTAESRGLQEQIAQLLGGSVSCMRSVAGWYKLSTVPSGVAAATATPPTGRPELRSAVPSTL